MKKYFVICLVSILIFAIFYGVWNITFSHHDKMLSPKQPSFPLQEATLQPFTYQRCYTGYIQPSQSVQVRPYLSGFLKDVFVQPGQFVQKDDILFILDQRIALADLNQAKANVLQSEAQRANALAYYERMQQTQSQAISPTELEEAKTRFQSTDAAYQQALAAQNQAQTVYDYTFIRAPITGRVGNITATIGAYLSPQDEPLAYLIKESPVRLSFAVPASENLILWPFEQGTLSVKLADNFFQKINHFSVLKDNHADSQTDAVSFFIDVPNENKNFIVGSYVLVCFDFQKEGILADKNWVSLTPDGDFVFIVNQSKVEKKSVQIGAPIQNQYWIQNGLKPGDKIITVPIPSSLIGQTIKEDG